MVHTHYCLIYQMKHALHTQHEVIQFRLYHHHLNLLIYANEIHAIERFMRPDV